MVASPLDASTVVNDVDGTSCQDLPPILLVVVDDLVGTEAAHRVEVLLAAGGYHSACTHSLGKLDANAAGAAAARQDKDRGERPPRSTSKLEAHQAGEGHGRQRSSLLQAQVGRLQARIVAVEDNVLRVSGAPRSPHLVADAEGAWGHDPLHRAGEVDAGDHALRVGQDRLPVARVHGGVRHPHQHLSGPRLGLLHGHLLDAFQVRVATRCDGLRRRVDALVARVRGAGVWVGADDDGGAHRLLRALRPAGRV
mmetsp:Transcript_98389/g.306407  ORF Transcript_98389/g.306407 Transcript_98389/m.306407 type:complete len:253 (+) Transcript_98389:315-1073(+)